MLGPKRNGADVEGHRPSTGGALALIRKLSAPLPVLVTLTVVVRELPGSMLDIMLCGMDTEAPLVCPRVMRNSASQATVPPSRP